MRLSDHSPATLATYVHLDDLPSADFLNEITAVPA
jgi:hypothetical protein